MYIYVLFSFGSTAKNQTVYNQQLILKNQSVSASLNEAHWLIKLSGSQVDLDIP